MMAKLHHPHAGLLLIRHNKQMMIPLSKDVMTLGRKSADIILDDPKVSSLHAEVRREGAGIVLADLESTNGTLVNKLPITKVELTDQDVIEVGSSTLCFFVDSRDFHGPTEETQAGSRRKEDTQSQDFKAESLTTTKTISQMVVRLEILEGPQTGKKFKLKKPHITIGRNETDLVLMDLDVSRVHALIEVLGKSSVFLKDMGSTNGTLVDGKRIQSEKMSSGDTFVVGSTRLKLTFDAAEGES
jgi:pSer/pThr/pTyr-binding forkhead associated (FHA) protein